LLTALAYSVAGAAHNLWSVARSTPDVGVGGERTAATPLEQFAALAQDTVPETDAYLLQDPWGAGRAHWLRYMLYPRRYERLALEATEADVRTFVRERDIGYILILDASIYPLQSWARTAGTWFDVVAESEAGLVLRVHGT
jgi:hypothetical protein